MSVKNSTILERAWLEAGNDYQQRIPDPSVSSFAEHVAELLNEEIGVIEVAPCVVLIDAEGHSYQAAPGQIG